MFEIILLIFLVIVTYCEIINICGELSGYNTYPLNSETNCKTIFYSLYFEANHKIASFRTSFK